MAFKGTMMQGKFPGGILLLEMPADLVDVNVHPAKTEVRFARENDIFDLVYHAVKLALSQPGTGERRFVFDEDKDNDASQESKNSETKENINVKNNCFTGLSAVISGQAEPGSLPHPTESPLRPAASAVPRPAQPSAPEQPVRREEDEDMRTAIIRAEISRFINAHYGEDISMQDAAAALRYSDAYFCKLFKQCFKVNFSAYLNEYRVNKARQLILDPRLSLKDIGAAVGYSDANYFTRVFKRLTGQTPSEYRMAAAEKAVQG